MAGGHERYGSYDDDRAETRADLKIGRHTILRAAGWLAVTRLPRSAHIVPQGELYHYLDDGDDTESRVITRAV